MKESKSKPNVSIRIDPDVLHQAKIEAVKSKGKGEHNAGSKAEISAETAAKH